LWTNSAANAAAACPFHQWTKPGTPLIGTAAHSALTFAKATQFPALEAWWSDPTAWWSMSGTTAFKLAMTSSNKIPADFDQRQPALPIFGRLTVLASRASSSQLEKLSTPLALVLRVQTTAIVRSRTDREVQCHHLLSLAGCRPDKS
jgi:hypothetical protein